MTPGEIVVAELKKQFGPSLEGRDALLHCIVGHVNGAVQNERERIAGMVRHANVYGGTDLEYLADEILGRSRSPLRQPIPSRPEIVAPLAGKTMAEAVIAERRVCEKPGCGNLLDDSVKAVYCSNQCARDDA